MISRREVLVSGAGALLLAGGARAWAREAEAQGAEAREAPAAPRTAGALVVPNGRTLPWKAVGDTKVFHLVAEPVTREFAPGLVLQCWGYNGATPGPVIEAIEGDRVRIYVTNRLPEATTVHWHGLHVPNGMDGVAGLTQPRIEPGQTFRYEFVLSQPGTFLYHPHFDEMVQMALGAMGMIVVHPRAPEPAPPDRDFAILLSEWAVRPGTSRPDPLEMLEFNVLTMNGKAYPATAPLVVRRGERVRIRLGNLSATDHHPIHLHGHSFRVVGTDGGPIPEAAQWPESTVLVPVGSTRTIELVAERAGDWPFHCHMTHHIMNQMGHGAPSMVGVPRAAGDDALEELAPGTMAMGHEGMGEMSGMQGMAVPKNSIAMQGGRGPFGPIDMGGMFTVLQVRDELRADGTAGDYAHPEGSVARRATAEELRADGIAKE